MAVTIESMLESLEEVLEEGVSVPLSGGKRMVDVDAARDIIDDIRLSMPSEIAQAKGHCAGQSTDYSQGQKRGR